VKSREGKEGGGRREISLSGFKKRECREPLFSGIREGKNGIEERKEAIFLLGGPN